MDIKHVIPNAVSVSAVETERGWAAALSVVPDADGDHLECIEAKGVTVRSDRTREQWIEAMTTQPARVVLLTGDGGEIGQQDIAEARRIEGPVIVGGSRPVLAWCERNGDNWRLVVWDWEAGPRRIVEHASPLLNLEIVRFRHRVLLACEFTQRGKRATGVWTESGECIYTVEGRRPRLAAVEDRFLLLVVEKADPRGMALLAHRFDGNTWKALGALPRLDDININIHLRSCDANGALYATWEACPHWGWDERVGLHRDIFLFRLNAEAGTWRPGPGTAGGRVPLPLCAFMDRTMFNLPPVHPFIVLIGTDPAIAFRRFRPTGRKFFGWDVLLATLQRGAWTEPSRLTPNPGPPDMGYALLPDGNTQTGFFTCCNHTPTAGFDSDPKPPNSLVRAAVDFRVEVVTVDPVSLPTVPHEGPPSQRTAYVIPPSVPAPAAEPEALRTAPDNLTLVWGDLHSHSSYSKCMSANDGDPADVVRYQRDVLGCRVLCVTDHVEYMSGQEFLHVLDAIDRAAAGDCVPLYGVEYARAGTHHTNFYAIDRGVFEHLRCILMEERSTFTAYGRVKVELPNGAVLALRHFHGTADLGTTSNRWTEPAIVETRDPQLEVAMEALQMRGNMMTDPYSNLPLFPNNFLDSGARLGLVGGSDHARGFDLSRNRFCLTGFWVPEVTPQAVFDAIKRRMTLAVGNGKIAVWADLNGSPAGSDVSVSCPFRISAELSSALPIRRVALIRDGKRLPWTELTDTQVTLEMEDAEAQPGPHWYVVHAEADSVLEGKPTVAFTSPFFVDVP